MFTANDIKTIGNKINAIYSDTPFSCMDYKQHLTEKAITERLFKCFYDKDNKVFMIQKLYNYFDKLDAEYKGSDYIRPEK